MHKRAVAFTSRAWTQLLLVTCLSGGSWNTAQADVITYKEGYFDPLSGSLYQGTADTTLEAVSINWVGSTANQNYGGRDYLAVGRNVTYGYYGPLRTLLRFDVSSLAGRYSSIDSVTLRLYPSYVFFQQSSATNSLAAYSISANNAGWVEGTGVTNDIGEPADTGMATWNQKIQGSTNWAGTSGLSSPGIDYASSALATTSYSTSTALNTAYDFVLTGQSAQDLIDQWLMTANSGILLRSGNDTSPWDTNVLRFWSSESANMIYRPELIVDYTALTAVPLPTPLLLLLSGFAGLFSAGLRKRA